MHCGKKRFFLKTRKKILAKEQVEKGIAPDHRLLARGLGILAALEVAHASKWAGSLENTYFVYES